MDIKLPVSINETAGRIYDILTAARWIYDEQGYEQSHAEAEIAPEKDIFSSIRYLKNNISLPQLKLDILFQNYKGDYFIGCYFREKLWDYANINEFFEDIQHLNSSSFTARLLQFFDQRCLELPQYQKETGSIAQITAFLEQTDIPDEIKYKLVVLLSDTAKLLSSITEFFGAINEKLTAIYNKYRKKLVDFRLNVEKPVLTMNDTILSLLAYRSFSLEQLSQYKSISVAGSFLDDIALVPLHSDSHHLQVVLGLNFKNIIRSQQDDRKISNVDFLSVTKALADKIRLDILDMLLEKGMYTSEISDALGMPFPKALYHINILANANIISSYTQGKRVYYEVNHAFFSYLIEFIKRKYI